jgi:hypothetical protein
MVKNKKTEDVGDEKGQKEEMVNISPLFDFLKTYGWAILVVIIALGALWYFIPSVFSDFTHYDDVQNLCSGECDKRGFDMVSCVEENDMVTIVCNKPDEYCAPLMEMPDITRCVKYVDSFNMTIKFSTVKILS